MKQRVLLLNNLIQMKDKDESLTIKEYLLKALDCVDHNKLWKILKEKWDYQAILPVSWETCM